MTGHAGLGEPRGPSFVSPDLEPPAQDRDPSAADPWKPRARQAEPREAGRAVVVAALVAAIVGGVTGTAAGHYAGRASPFDSARLPQSSAGPVRGGGSSLSDVAARVMPSVVSIELRSGNTRATGSGFIIDRLGHVLTNNHVVAGGGSLTVVLHDGRRITATVVGRDINSDLAVLRIPPLEDLRPIRLGRSADVHVGDTVIAIGSPLGLSGTVTSGIVSALNRQVRLGNAGRHLAVQTDASINPGNSGGPLVNARGEAIGVNTAIATLERTGGNSGSIGIGFAIPVDQAASVARRIIRES